MGVPVTGSLSGTGDEKYYQVNIAAGQHLFVVLDSASNSYSSELYIKFGSLPSTVDYDDKGNSPNTDQAVEIASTQAGYYYILVRSTYGGWDYTIEAHTNSTFPTLALGAAQSGSLQGTYDIKYVQVSMTAGQHLFVVLDSASNSYSSELYIKFGSLPSTVDYDDKGNSPNADQAVEITSTQTGYYYILVRSTYGRWDYTIEAHTNSTFPTLTLRVAQSGSLQGTYDIKYVQVSVTAGQHLFVILDSASNSYSSELYIKFGSLPSTVDYDDKGDSPNADQAVEITSTQTGYYYILVRSTYGRWDYTIEAHTNSTFPALPPTPPTDLRARAGLALITLEWTPSTSADLAGYNVYRSTSPSSSFAKVNLALATGDTWSDVGPGLITGTLYYYCLTAVDSLGQESALSNTASATFGQVQLSIPDMQGPHGVSVTVPINIANATGLSIDAMDVYVVYTPTTLTATEVRRTILSLDYGFALNLVQPGVVRVALASGAGGPPLQGPGTLFQLVFDVPGTAGATSSLDFDVAQTDLYGNGDLSQPVPLSLDNGSFTVAAGYVLGDLNGDGVVTSADADLALQIAVGLVTPTPQQQAAGDVNGDGRLNAADAALIMRMAAGLPLLPGGITAEAPGRRTPVNLRIPDVSGAPGQTIIVPLNISNAAYVAGADLTVNYDPTIVTAESVRASDLTNYFTVQAGTGRSGAVRVSLRPQAGHESGLTGGTGSLVTLRFRINDTAQPGTVSRFTLAAGRLNDTYSRDFAGSALQTAVYLFSGRLTVSRRVYLPLVLRPYPFVMGPAD